MVHMFHQASPPCTWVDELKLFMEAIWLFRALSGIVAGFLD